jgi:hypothetical protein
MGTCLIRPIHATAATSAVISMAGMAIHTVEAVATSSPESV